MKVAILNLSPVPIAIKHQSPFCNTTTVLCEIILKKFNKYIYLLDKGWKSVLTFFYIKVIIINILKIFFNFVIWYLFIKYVSDI